MQTDDDFTAGILASGRCQTKRLKIDYMFRKCDALLTAASWEQHVAPDGEKLLYVSSTETIS